MLRLTSLLVGLAAGFAVAFVGGSWWIAVGALAGLAVGQVLSREPRPEPAPEPPPGPKAELDAAARGEFAKHLCSLFVLVAEVDGEMTREEAAAIRAFFEDNLGFGPDELEQVRVQLKAAMQRPQPISFSCAAARRTLGQAELSLLYYALWRVADADRPISRLEEDLLYEIAVELQLDPDLAAAMGGPRRRPRRAARPRPSARPRPAASQPEPETEPESEEPAEQASPYARLGITAAASDAEVKKAFRALAQKMHPDKVAHLGPRAQETAVKAFAEVNLAYEVIRKERGL